MRIAIIHPWLPQYRVRFFEELTAQGRAAGLQIDVFYGETPPEWRERQDSRTTEGFTRLETQFFSISKNKFFSRKSLAPLKNISQYDLIIVEQAVRNLETYELLLRRRPVAFWGHGKTFTKQVSPQQDWFKQWVTRQGIWFFAYTSEGADAMASTGMSIQRISVVQNSIDTKSLRDQTAAVRPESLASFMRRHDLHGRTALFMGGLDQSKRLPFLFAAAQEATRLDPNFRLLVAGSGDDQALAECASADIPSVHYLGPLFGPDKAVALAASEVIAMPGRVGLVAVDSFASLTPIVTTNWKWHSVEFAYLESEVNAVVTADSAGAFARGLVDTLGNESRLASLREGCRAARDKYTLDAMVSNFLSGILGALKAGHL